VRDPIGKTLRFSGEDGRRWFDSSRLASGWLIAGSILTAAPLFDLIHGLIAFLDQLVD
jgi:hypothetical protein